MREILVYQPIYSGSAETFITQMEAAKNSDVTIRVNCPGGETFMAFGMFAKFNEHKKGKTVKVDGKAFSGGAFFCCFAEHVEATDASQFLLHRSAYPSWFESDTKLFTDEAKALLNNNNASLRSAMESKLDLKKFEKVTGKTLDEMFSLDSRIDITLTAVQAKEIGLVQKIVPLNQVKKAEINALCASVGIAALYTPDSTSSINTNMDIKNLADLKAAYPGLFAEAKAEGATEERDRIQSWMVYNDIDPKAVAEGIESGKDVSRKQAHEFNVKGMAKMSLDKTKADNADAVTTPEAAAAPAAQTAAEKNAADFLANCKKDLNLK